MQNHTLESTINSLTETRTMLSGARVRNYDLATALAVLSTGTYPGLPASMREGFEEGAEKMGDDEVIETLREVDEVIRWRLVMGREYVPDEMRRRRWRVGDGRVVFEVEGLWEASFTYGGGKEDPGEDEDDQRGHEGAEWFLLGVKFLFRVKDARGGESAAFPPSPMSARSDSSAPAHSVAQSGPPPLLDHSRTISSTSATDNYCASLIFRLRPNLDLLNLTSTRHHPQRRSRTRTRKRRKRSGRRNGER